MENSAEGRYQPTKKNKMSKKWRRALSVSFVLIFYMWFHQNCSASCNMKLSYSNQNGLKELSRKIWKTDHRAIVSPLIKQDCLHPQDLWLNSLSPLLKQLYILISSRSIYFIKSCKTVARSHSLNKSTLLHVPLIPLYTNNAKIFRVLSAITGDGGTVCTVSDWV